MPDRSKQILTMLSGVVESVGLEQEAPPEMDGGVIQSQIKIVGFPDASFEQKAKALRKAMEKWAAGQEDVQGVQVLANRVGPIGMMSVVVVMSE